MRKRTDEGLEIVGEVGRRCRVDDGEKEAAGEIDSAVICGQPAKSHVVVRDVLVFTEIKNETYAGVHQSLKFQLLLTSEIRKDGSAIIEKRKDEGGNKPRTQRKSEAILVVLKSP
jgi:predicted metal-binding transcription factor (methanogenesis marker protein 9)